MPSLTVRAVVLQVKLRIITSGLLQELGEVNLFPSLHEAARSIIHDLEAVKSQENLLVEVPSSDAAQPAHPAAPLASEGAVVAERSRKSRSLPPLLAIPSTEPERYHIDVAVGDVTSRPVTTPRADRMRHLVAPEKIASAPHEEANAHGSATIASEHVSLGLLAGRDASAVDTETLVPE
jgi:hypothetical protein